MSEALYMGAAGKTARYLGARPDAEAYLGEGSLWPAEPAISYSFDPMNTFGLATLSGGGSVFESGPEYGHQEVRGFNPFYGKVYVEFTLEKYTGGRLSVGLHNASYFGRHTWYNQSQAILFKFNTEQRVLIGQFLQDYTLSTIAEGDVICMAYDSDALEISFKVNGNDWVGPFKTSVFAFNRVGAPLVPVVSVSDGWESTRVLMNTGQVPYIYTPPTGFAAPSAANVPVKSTNFRFKPSDRNNNVSISNDGRTITNGWGMTGALNGAHSIGELPDKSYVEFTVNNYVDGMAFGLSTEDVGGYFGGSAMIYAKPSSTVGSSQIWTLYLVDEVYPQEMGTVEAILGTGSVVSMAFDIEKGDHANPGMGTFRLRVNGGDWITAPIMLGIDSLCPFGLIPLEAGAMSLNAGHAPFVYAPPSGYSGPEA